MAGKYITSAGEQWDTIAKKVYDDELKADYLMAHNLPLLDIYEFDARVTVLVPQLPAENNSKLPGWRSK